MKRIQTLLTTLAIALGTMVTTSCERGTIIIDDGGSADWGITRYLEGTWVGDIGLKTVWDGIPYKVAESEITFVASGYRRTYGTGYWVDFFSDYRWDYVANHTKWEVFDREIRVDLLEDGDRIWISDFTISNNYFDGWIDFADGDAVKFRLRKVSGPSWDWDDYYWGWGYWEDYLLSKAPISDDFNIIVDDNNGNDGGNTGKEGARRNHRTAKD